MESAQYRSLINLIHASCLSTPRVHPLLVPTDPSNLHKPPYADTQNSAVALYSPSIMRAEVPAAVAKVIDRSLTLIYDLGPIFAPTVVLGTSVVVHAAWVLLCQFSVPIFPFDAEDFSLRPHSLSSSYALYAFLRLGIVVFTPLWRRSAHLVPFSCDVLLQSLVLCAVMCKTCRNRLVSMSRRSTTRSAFSSAIRSP
jgi:hypothetical protein